MTQNPNSVPAETGVRLAVEASEGIRRRINMPKKGHTEEQIIAALKQYEAGDETVDICRKLGVSQAAFCMWKKQYAGLGVQELRELRNLREEKVSSSARILAGDDPSSALRHTLRQWPPTEAARL
jgi:putative transposase